MTHAPVSEKERITEIDIVRGFALFGVLLVNVACFNGTFLSMMTGNAPLTNPLQLHGIDRTITLAIKLFAEGKFYTIFSFLFGLGFYIFISRAVEKGLPSKPLFRRRMFALLIFGLLNLILVWWGDILHVYSLGGFIFLAFDNKPVKALVRWSIILLIFSAAVSMLFSSSPATIQSRLSANPSSNNLVSPEWVSQSIEVFQNGGFAEIVRFRVFSEIPFLVAYLLFMLPKTMAMFILGMIAGKLKVFNNISGNLLFINRTWALTGVLGCLTLAGALLSGYPVMSGSLNNPVLYSLLYELSTVSVSLFYITSLLKLLTIPRVAVTLRPLQAVGRMALTNYLVQCIVCSLVFYGHGLGYLGRMSMGSGVIFTISFYATQVVISNLWFKHYKFGPFERIWRDYTYKKHVASLQHSA
ncbi:MAG: hypothetical protein FD169_2005 [Bacillota bacterium]|nr:MAG: hypothetical protein FD169_2005 [Bacillota bacterium]